MQRKINGLLYRIDQNVEFHSHPFVIIPANSDLQRLNNKPGQMYESRNVGAQKAERPFQVVPTIMHPQIFDYLEANWHKGMTVGRMSEAWAEGKSPQGTDPRSGKALSIFNDIENSRFSDTIAQYEDLYIEIAKRIVEWGIDLGSKKLKAIKKKKKEFLDTVDQFSTNLLPETPQGRYNILSQLSDRQIISPERFLELLDAPDISSFVRSKNARVVAITKYQEDCFYNNKPCSVDKTLGYEEQLEIAISIYAKIFKDDPRDKRLFGVRNYLTSLEEIIEEFKKKQIAMINSQIAPPTQPAPPETQNVG